MISLFYTHHSTGGKCNSVYSIHVQVHIILQEGSFSLIVITLFKALFNRKGVVNTSRILSFHTYDFTGGKWTTYRHMAEETLDKAVQVCGLKPSKPCQTKGLLLDGAHGWTPTLFIRLVQDFGLENEVSFTSEVKKNPVEF